MVGKTAVQWPLNAKRARLKASKDNKSEYIHYACFCCLEKIRHLGNKPPILLPFNIFFHFKLQNWKFEVFKETEISFVVFFIVNFLYYVIRNHTLQKAQVLNESFLWGHSKTLHDVSLYERASVACTKNKQSLHKGQAGALNDFIQGCILPSTSPWWNPAVRVPGWRGKGEAPDFSLQKSRDFS